MPSVEGGHDGFRIMNEVMARFADEASLGRCDAIRNREGPKQADEIRREPGGRHSRTNRFT